jgi:hypothetical protein
MKINYLLLIILINTSIVIGQGTQALSPTKIKVDGVAARP